MTRLPGVIVSSVATAFAAFLLYTNLIVVASQRGIVPAAVAMIVPALLALAVAHRVVVRREPVIVDRTFVVMIAFLGVLLLSAFAAEGYSVAVSRIAEFGVEGLATYFLVRNAVRTIPDVRVAVGAVLAAAALLAALSIFQSITKSYEQEFLGLAQRSLEHMSGPPGSGGAEMGLEDRAFGPVGDPNRFAQILLMTLPLAFVLGLNARRRATLVVAGVFGTLILAGVLLTYSRGAFLTLVVLVILCAPLGLVRPRRVFAALAAGIILTPIVVPGYAGRVLSISGVAALWGSTEVVADGPTRGRTTEMLAALAAYTDHAVLGVGPGQYLPYYSVRYQALPEVSIRELAEPRRAHSLYLEMAAETGTIGLMIFLAIPLLLLRDLRQARVALVERRPDLARLAAGFSLLVLAYLGTGVFLHLAFERYYWFMIGLTAAAAGAMNRYLIESAEQERPPSAWARRPTAV